MKHRVVADLSSLPLHGKGSSSTSWWGTLAFMLIEGTGFALAIAVYLYLMSNAAQWPINSPPPGLLPGSVLTVIFLISVVPNMLVSRWAEQQYLLKVRFGLVVMSLFGIATLIVRIFEFKALNVHWDDNAYGSIVWLLLGLHTTHILTDVGETFVLTALMFTGHAHTVRRFSDVEDNALYWNFVVLTWLPIYGCIYWLAR
jgi:cytochrome c oxidase subunit 3